MATSIEQIDTCHITGVTSGNELDVSKLEQYADDGIIIARAPIECDGICKTSPEKCSSKNDYGEGSVTFSAPIFSLKAGDSESFIDDADYSNTYSEIRDDDQFHCVSGLCSSLMEIGPMFSIKDARNMVLRFRLDANNSAFPKIVAPEGTAEGRVRGHLVLKLESNTFAVYLHHD